MGFLKQKIKISIIPTTKFEQANRYLLYYNIKMKQELLVSSIKDMLKVHMTSLLLLFSRNGKISQL